jgi:hypothetical protein
MSSIARTKVEQPGGEFSPAAAKTGASNAGFPIIGKLAAVYLDLLYRRNLFVPPHSQRSACQIYLHRLNAMAEWKAVAETLA